MTENDDIQDVVEISRRRLKKLMEQRARLGYDTPPQILMEIEDIEAKIQDLEDEKTRSDKEVQEQGLALPVFGVTMIKTQDSAVAIGDNASASNLKIDLKGANIETLIARGTSKPAIRLQASSEKPPGQTSLTANLEGRQTDPLPAPALLRVFLSYASEDRAMVREVYDRLRGLSIDAWLDDENLLPGQDWQAEIRKAVRLAHVVIVFLSHKTVTKTGYVQKEIKYALDVADEQPEGTIFLIPAKLEDCQIPDRLAHLQWVDLTDGRGWSRLVKALERRAEAIGINPPPV